MMSTCPRTRSRPVRAVALVVAAALSLAAVSCAAGPAFAPAARLVADESAKLEPLRAGDLLVIRALNHSKLSVKKAEVDSHGMIEVPKLGAIRAEGLTPDELERVIQQHFRKYKAHRRVIVFVNRIEDGR